MQELAGTVGTEKASVQGPTDSQVPGHNSSQRESETVFLTPDGILKETEAASYFDLLLFCTEEFSPNPSQINSVLQQTCSCAQPQQSKTSLPKTLRITESNWLSLCPVGLQLFLHWNTRYHSETHTFLIFVVD